LLAFADVETDRFGRMARQASLPASAKNSKSSEPRRYYRVSYGFFIFPHDPPAFAALAVRSACLLGLCAFAAGLLAYPLHLILPEGWWASTPW